MTGRISLGLLVIVALACQPSASDAGPEPSPEERVQAAMIKAGRPCEKASDCGSRACLGSCMALADAGHPWVEMAIAGAMKDLLAEHPEQWPVVLASAVELAPPDSGTSGGTGYARARVAGFLGALGDRRAEPFLATLVADKDPLVAVRAQLALLRLCTPAGFEATSSLLAQESLAVRLDALDAVGGCSANPKAGPILLAALAGDEPRMVERAIYALTRVPTAPKGALAALKQRVSDDPDSPLGRDLARAIAHLATLSSAP